MWEPERSCCLEWRVAVTGRGAGRGRGFHPRRNTIPLGCEWSPRACSPESRIERVGDRAGTGDRIPRVDSGLGLLAPALGPCAAGSEPMSSTSLLCPLPSAHWFLSLLARIGGGVGGVGESWSSASAVFWALAKRPTQAGPLQAFPGTGASLCKWVGCTGRQLHKARRGVWSL